MLRGLKKSAINLTNYAPNKNTSNHNNPRNNTASIMNPNIPPIKANGRDSSEKQNLNKSTSNGPKHLIRTIISIIMNIVVSIVTLLILFS